MDMRSVGSGRGRGCVGPSLGAAQSAALLWESCSSSLSPRGAENAWRINKCRLRVTWQRRA
eukprot:5888121-Prymnesium_polylepis.1